MLRLMERDDDLALFARLSSEIYRKYETDEADAWKDSCFEWIHTAPSARKGAVGKALVRRWAEEQGRQISRALEKGHSFCVDGLRVAVKLSLVWSDGLFAFEQLRDEPYDVACLLGLEPDRVHLWCVPKPVLLQNAPGQHTGAQARETRWIQFPAADPPGWLVPYGDTPAEADDALEQARRELRP